MDAANTSSTVSDTKRSPVVELMDPAMVEIMRRKTPAQRLEIGFGMWETARLIIRGSVQQQYPHWSESMVDQEVVRRISRGEIDPAKFSSTTRPLHGP